MFDKLQVPCARCEHNSVYHDAKGAHKCFVPDCGCNYFVVPKDIDDINTPDNVEMTFRKDRPVTDNTLSNKEDILSNYEKVARGLGLNDTDIASGIATLDGIAEKLSGAFIPNQGEIRTVASTGAEKGVKEARYDLIPVPALDLLARLYGKGASKYAAHNWRRGYEWSKSYAAALRHMTLFWEGEDIDPEMQLPHVICASFHMFALATYMTEHPEMDDRFHTIMAREAAESEEETHALTTADILEELANDYINQGKNETAKVLLAVARDEKVK